MRPRVVKQPTQGHRTSGWQTWNPRKRTCNSLLNIHWHREILPETRSYNIMTNKHCHLNVLRWLSHLVFSASDMRGTVCSKKKKQGTILKRSLSSSFTFSCVRKRFEPERFRREHSCYPHPFSDYLSKWNSCSSPLRWAMCLKTRKHGIDRSQDYCNR